MRNLVSAKKYEIKSNHTETHYNQTYKSQRQREALESSKCEATHCIQGRVFNNIIRWCLIRNFGGQKAMANVVKVQKEKQNVNQDSDIWKKCLSKVREKLRHYQINKAKRVCYN